MTIIPFPFLSLFFLFPLFFFIFRFFLGPSYREDSLSHVGLPYHVTCLICRKGEKANRSASRSRSAADRRLAIASDAGEGHSTPAAPPPLHSFPFGFFLLSPPAELLSQRVSRTASPWEPFWGPFGTAPHLPSVSKPPVTANFMLFIYFFAFLFFLNPRELHRCTRSKL
jgi:hypothetical protein